MQYGIIEKRQIQPAGNHPSNWNYKSITDPWFQNHFLWCADICENWIGSSTRVLDFGCNADITGLGLALRYNHEVLGVDISPKIHSLSSRAKRQICLEKLPNNISLHQIKVGSNLQEFGFFDAIIAGSVFEHVDMNYMYQIIHNFRSVLKPGGVIFIQIEPMWLSPYGSHLQRFLKEPWAHLLYERDEIRSLVLSAPQPENFQPTSDNMPPWEHAKTLQLGEFDKLNRIRIDDIIKLFSDAGYLMVREERNQVHLDPPLVLKSEYSESELKTHEIRFLYIDNSKN